MPKFIENEDVMKTILILTDYSYSSFNAARYALTFAGTFDAAKVILYNSFNYLADSAGELAMLSAGLDKLRQDSEERMADLQISLEPFQKPGTLVEALTDDRHLIAAVGKILSDYKVDVIIAGSKNRSAVGMLLIGSRIVDLIDNFDVPILIVPSAYIYEPVMCAVLATDLLEVEKLPQKAITKFINDYRCKLIVLNVDSHEEEHSDIGQILAIGELHKILDPNRPDYHYTNSRDISKGIRGFCNDHHAGLVMVIHKEHSFVHNLLFRSVEKEMTLHSNVPLLILKQVKEDEVQRRLSISRSSI